jgi:LPS export ABC transporter protein LptC
MSDLNASTKAALPLPLHGRRGLVFAGSLAALIFLFIPWFQNQQDTPTLALDNEQEEALALQPSSTASGVTWQVFSQTGQLSYEISASKLQQFSNEQFATIVGPSIQVQDKELRPWQISAGQGKVSQGNQLSDQDDQIELFERVRITQAQRQNALGGISIETSKLSIYPNDKRAYTEESVIVKHPRFITRSNGLDLDLQTGTLRFIQGDITRVVSKLFLHEHSEDS